MFAKVVQHRAPGAEVVHRDPDPHRAQRAEDPGIVHHVASQALLGHFEDERGGRQTRAFERTGDLVEQHVPGTRDARRFDGDRRRWIVQPISLPAGNGAARLVEHEASALGEHPAALRHGQERLGGYVTEGRVRPPEAGLEADDPVQIADQAPDLGVPAKIPQADGQPHRFPCGDRDLELRLQHLSRVWRARTRRPPRPRDHAVRRVQHRAPNLCVAGQTDECRELGRRTDDPTVRVEDHDRIGRIRSERRVEPSL